MILSRRYSLQRSHQHRQAQNEENGGAHFLRQPKLRGNQALILPDWCKSMTADFIHDWYQFPYANQKSSISNNFESRIISTFIF